MLTGLLPRRHGVRENIGYSLREDVVTLAERLAQAGYQTGGFVGGLPLAKAGGLGQGFAEYDDVMPERALGEGGVAEREERPAEDVLAAAGAWLRRTDPERPVFAFVHLYDPHAPYEHALPGAAAPSYDGEIAHVDQELGRLAASLAADPRWKDLIWIVTSDHGEGLGEHAEQTHCVFTYESTLHVPLVVAAPGRVTPRRAADVVGVVDVTPTVLELAGVAGADDADGRSLAPALSGRSLPARDYQFESLFGLLNFDWAPLRGVRSGALKLIDAPRPELYDLGADPGERHDLASARPDDVRRLQALVTAEDAPASGSEAEMEKERLAGLTALGYVAAPPVQRAAAGDRPDPKDRIADYEAYQRAHALASAGDMAGADGLMASVAPRFAKSPAFFLAWAQFAGRRGDAARAGELLGKVLELDPDNAEARLNLAVSLLERDRPEDALHQLDALLARHPDHPEGLRYSGLVLSRMPGHVTEALARWRRFLAVAPDHPQAARIRAAIAPAEAARPGGGNP